MDLRAQTLKMRLANTLVPLIMLEIPLWAATPVSANDILATMLASVISITLIHICNKKKKA